MRNIIEICNSLGITVPEDKKDELTKQTLEEYVTINEHNKKVNTLTEERDGFKEKYETAEATLKKFEGIDPDNIKKEIDDWKTKAEDMEKDFKEKMKQRDFEDALNEEIGKYKFTSNSAKKAVISEIKSKNLTFEDGKILGLSDAIEQIKNNDKDAFVEEDDNKDGTSKAHFTRKIKSKGYEGLTRDDFKNMSLDERIKLKNENPSLYEEMRKNNINTGYE